jgi:hypothetical protein
MNALRLSIFVILYCVFLYWYIGSGHQCTDEAFNNLLVLQKNNEEHVQLQGLLELKEADTGTEFFMVNLIKWNKVAQYEKGSAFEAEVDPVAANNRYGMFVVPELLKRGSFPIFLSKLLAKGIIYQDDDTNWDNVAIVRYRSFADFVDFMKVINVSGAAEHKFAAIEKTLVMPTQMSPAIFAYVIPLLVALICFIVAHLISSCFPPPVTE